MSHERPWHHRLFYAWVRGGCAAAGWLFFPSRVFGLEHLPKSGGAMLCSNHQSFIDPVVVGVICPRQIGYLARKSLFQRKLSGRVIHMLNAIPIDREGMGIGGLKEMLRRLKRGEMVLMFPEGSRSPDGEVQPLQPGFLAVARRGKVPLIPMGLDGAYQAWPRHRKYPLPARIRVYIAPPITVAEMEAASDEQLLAKLTSAIANCHAQARAARGG